MGGEVLIGQPENFYGPGAVYVYRGDGSGSWSAADRLFAPDSTLRDDFGRDLAAAGDVLLVGAPGQAGGGVIYLFARDGAGAWQAADQLVAPAGAESGFGTSVALGDGFAIVGAPGAEAGSGLAYEIGVDGGRLAVRSVLRARALDGARFGTDVSLAADRLLVGAPGARGGDGAGVVFQRRGGAWSEEALLVAEGADRQERGQVGTSVELAGDRAILGAPGGGGGTGTVLTFTAGANGWDGPSTVSASGVSRGSGFGTALAALEGELWVGAPRGGGGDGVVYRFEERAGGWTEVDRIAADSANTAQWPFGFGSSVALSDEAVIVGMPTRDFGEGRAAILQRSGTGWDEVATLSGEIAKAVTSIETGADCEEGTVPVFDCQNIEVVSFTPVSELGGARGVWVNDVWGWTDSETGRNYALVARRDGAAFVDLTNPAQPSLVGTLPRTSGSRPSVWRDIKVYADHAYIVSDGAGAHGMQVFDLTRLRGVTGEPVEFDMDAHYRQIFSAHNVVADTDSGFLYIVGASGGGETCGGGLHIVDVRTPKSPTFAGCYTDRSGERATGYTHDAQCVVYRGPDDRYQGRQICVGSNATEINIADVTDKDRPVPIGRSSYPSVAYAHQGWFDETQRYFYMGDEGDEVAGLVGSTRTLIWDLAELDDPILVNEYFAPVAASDHNMFIKGDRIYQSNYGSGLRVLNISDPVNPFEEAFFDSAPIGNNEPGMSSAVSGAWSNYPFFENGLVVFTSVREGLFVVRVKSRPVS